MNMQNILQALPILAAGFTGDPQTLQRTMAATQYGQQTRQDENLRAFGRAIFGQGRPPTQQDIMDAAGKYGIDPMQATALISKFQKETGRAPQLQEIKRGEEIVTGYFGEEGEFTPVSRAPRWQPAEEPTEKPRYTKIRTVDESGRPVWKFVREDQPGEYLIHEEGAPKERFKDETSLRKEYSGESKKFIAIRDSFGTVLASAEDPSPAGDIGLIFSVMKMFDPTSVVREGEFATAANAGSVPERVVAQYNRALRGERLTPSQREDFVSTAKRTYEQSKKGYDRLRERYTGLAVDYGFKPENIVFDYALQETPPPGEAHKEPQAAAPPQAIRFLRQNPDLKSQFMEKYGYLPEGM